MKLTLSFDGLTINDGRGNYLHLTEQEAESLLVMLERLMKQDD